MVSSTVLRSSPLIRPSGANLATRTAVAPWVKGRSRVGQFPPSPRARGSPLRTWRCAYHLPPGHSSTRGGRVIHRQARHGLLRGMEPPPPAVLSVSPPVGVHGRVEEPHSSLSILATTQTHSSMVSSVTRTPGHCSRSDRRMSRAQSIMAGSGSQSVPLPFPRRDM